MSRGRTRLTSCSCAIDDGDEFIGVTDASAATCIYLPMARGTGRILIVKLLGSQHVYVYPTGIDTIDGSRRADQINVAFEAHSYLDMSVGAWGII